ncbi:unnamed protein product, partial [Allacma fusca]
QGTVEQELIFSQLTKSRQTTGRRNLEFRASIIVLTQDGHLAQQTPRFHRWEFLHLNFAQHFELQIRYWIPHLCMPLEICEKFVPRSDGVVSIVLFARQNGHQSTDFSSKYMDCISVLEKSVLSTKC